MAYRVICAALLLSSSSLLIAGCGTVSNLAALGPDGGGMTPFGGVKQDEWWIQKAANGDVCVGTQHSKAEAAQHPQVALMVLYAADWPLSLIGDLVTWPYVASYLFINEPIPAPTVTQATIENPPQNPPFRGNPGSR